MMAPSDREDDACTADDTHLKAQEGLRRLHECALPAFDSPKAFFITPKSEMLAIAGRVHCPRVDAVW
jgi:hypothetical protein